MGAKTIRFCMYISVIMTAMFAHVFVITFPPALVVMVAQNDSAQTASTCNKDEIGDIVFVGQKSGKQFIFDYKVRGQLLASYYYGFSFGFIPAIYIVNNCGPIDSVGLAMILSALINSAIPIAMRIHWSLVFCIRILLGASSSIQITAILEAINSWGPKENVNLTYAMWSGLHCASLTLPIVGKVIDLWGWRWSFYFISLSTLVWLCLSFAVCLGSAKIKEGIISGPEEPGINPEPIQPIQTMTAMDDSVTRSEPIRPKKKKETPPYRKMFVSGSMWAIIISNFASQWAYNTYINDGFEFLADVLKFKYMHTTLLVAMPILVRLGMSFVFTGIHKVLMSHTKITVTEYRRWFTIFSHILPGILLIALRAKDCHYVFIMTLITASFALNGAIVNTAFMNVRDVAPRYMSSCRVIVYGFGATSGFFSASTNAAVSSDTHILENWHNVFLIAGNMYLLCGIFYMFCVTGLEQPWSKQSQRSKPNTDSSTRPDNETAVQQN